MKITVGTDMEESTVAVVEAHAGLNKWSRSAMLREIIEAWERELPRRNAPRQTLRPQAQRQ